MSATIGKGTTIGRGTAQAGPFTTVAKIRQGIKPPPTKVGSAEITTYEDTSEQFIPGFSGAGEGGFVALYLTATTAALTALIGTVLWWQITLPDTHTWTFQGWIEEYAPDVPLKEGVVDAVKIKVTGLPEYD